MKRIFFPILMVSWIVQAVAGQPQSDRRTASVIVVPNGKQADELRRRVRAGESFDLLAMKYSTGQSALDGGYIGTIRAADVSPDLQLSLERLKPGDVSPVTKVGGAFLLLRWSTAAEDSWRTRYASGLLALQQQRYPEAVALLSEALAEAAKFGLEDVRYARSLSVLSQAHCLQGHYAEAEPVSRQSVALFEKLLGPQHPGVIQSLENLAAIGMAQGKYVEAGQIYRNVLSIRWSGPANVGRVDVVELLEDLAALLSAGYFRDAQLDEASRKFEESIAKAPLRQELYAGIRDGFLRVDLVTEAEAVMQRAVLAFPNSREIRYALAEMYAKTGKMEKAVAAFEQAIRLQGPTDPAADREQRSVIYESIGKMDVFLVRFDDALAAYKTSLEFNPNNLKARMGLADLYVRRGRSDEALTEYLRVVSISPENAAAYRELAEVHLQLERYSDSAAAAQKALQLNPEERRSRYIEAIALIRGGSTEQGQTALQEYERLEAEALAAEKQRREILELNRSAAVKLIEGQQEEAIGLFRRALDSHPDRGDDEARIYLSLGLAQAKLGRNRDAAETFQTMIDRGISDFLIHRNLAAQYELLGDSRSLEQRAVYFQKYDAALKAILK